MPQAKPDLAAALADVSGSARRRSAPQHPANTASAKESNSRRSASSLPALVSVPPSRIGTVPITGHFPPEIRDQLKILAVERRATMNDLIAEAYNDLFAKYGKPEIAPRKKANR